MLKIGFVSCVKQKQVEPGPAELLYTSPLFAKARAYVMRCYDRWYILSAKHHLLEPSAVVAPYEETLAQKSSVERKRWALIVYKQIRAVVPLSSECSLFFHAGVHYREPLSRLLQEAGYVCEAPLAGLGIGQQLGWYKRFEERRTCHYGKPGADSSPSNRNASA